MSFFDNGYRLLVCLSYVAPCPCFCLIVVLFYILFYVNSASVLILKLIKSSAGNVSEALLDNTEELHMDLICLLVLSWVTSLQSALLIQIKIKSLLLSHHHSTSALVSEILTSVLQTVQKKKQFTYRQYIFTDCTEDNVQNTHTYTQYT